MLFFILVLVLALPPLAQPHTTLNCFRFASSFAFSPCLQCLPGYYVTSGKCQSCSKSMPDIYRPQCESRTDYGTNIRSAIENDQGTEVKQMNSSSLEYSFANCIEFLPVSNLTDQQVGNATTYGDKDNEQVCQKCKDGFELDNITFLCSEQKNKIECQHCKNCLIFSAEKDMCMECEEGHVLKEGMCLEDKNEETLKIFGEEVDELAQDGGKEGKKYILGNQFEIPAQIDENQELKLVNEKQAENSRHEGINLNAKSLHTLDADTEVQLLPESKPQSPLILSLEEKKQPLGHLTKETTQPESPRSSESSKPSEGGQEKEQTPTLDQNNSESPGSNCVKYSIETGQCIECLLGYKLDRYKKCWKISSTYSYLKGSFWQLKISPETIYTLPPERAETLEDLVEIQDSYCAKMNHFLKKCQECEWGYFLNPEGNCLSQEEFAAYLVRKYSRYIRRG